MYGKGSADGTVKLFQISGKKLLQTYQHSQSRTTQSSDTATSGSTFAGGSERKKPNSKQLHRIAEESSAEENQLQVNDGNDMEEEDDEEEEEDEDGEELQSVECVDFSSTDYKWIASGGLDKTLKIWDSVSGFCRAVCGHPASVVALKWHARLPVVITAALDSLIRIFDARAGKCRYCTCW